MGLFDWFKRGRKSPKETKEVPQDQVPVDNANIRPDDMKELLLQLESEKRRNIEQEKRMKEMENRFSKMQENWAELLDEQQKMIKTMAEERDFEKKKSAKRGPKSRMDVTGQRSSGTISQTILEEKMFTNFVVDDANRFPYLAAEAVATGIGRRYNPLFIYGDVGVGKTHLLHAIANKIFEVDPSKIILYSSTEKFTDELIKALEKDDLEGFRVKYRNVDVLLIDDIQMLSGREATQKEFFHMFNHLYNLGKQIVLCSDRPPAAIKELEARLRSRFEGGLIIDINVPTFEGRRQILLNLAQEDGYSLSTEVLDYMAFYLDSSVRELEGGFNRVTAYASLMKEPITVSLVRKVLEGVLTKLSTRKDREEDQPLPLEEISKPVPIATPSPYSDLELEIAEETDKLEQELLFELKRDSKGLD
jgi:chromosomal replication initiator protein DnaA